VVICLVRGADLHTAQLMPLPLTVSCFSKLQMGFTFLVLAHPGSPGQRAVKRVCVCVCVCVYCTTKYGDSVDNTVDENSGLRRLLFNLVAVSKGLRAVKLCTNKILQFLTGGAG